MAFFIGLRHDDFEYQSAFAALDELRLGNLKPFFKNHFLQGDTLFFMNSKEELRNSLTKVRTQEHMICLNEYPNVPIKREV